MNTTTISGDKHLRRFEYAFQKSCTIVATSSSDLELTLGFINNHQKGISVSLETNSIIVVEL